MTAHPAYTTSAAGGSFLLGVVVRCRGVLDPACRMPFLTEQQRVLVHQLRYGAHAHLRHHPTAMDLDGSLAQSQLLTDFLVRQAADHEVTDLSFARCECLPSGG